MIEESFSSFLLLHHNADIFDAIVSIKIVKANKFFCVPYFFMEIHLTLK